MLRGIGTSKGIGIGKALIIHKCKNSVSRVKIKDTEAEVDKFNEAVKLSKYGKLQQYNSAAEEGYVEDILFRGNHLDVTVNIGGTMITGEWSLEKEPLQVGEKVHVLIYRIYAVDDEKTYLCENKGMRDDDVFYI